MSRRYPLPEFSLWCFLCSWWVSEARTATATATAATTAATSRRSRRLTSETDTPTRGSLPAAAFSESPTTTQTSRAGSSFPASRCRHAARVRRCRRLSDSSNGVFGQPQQGLRRNLCCGRRTHRRPARLATKKDPPQASASRGSSGYRGDSKTGKPKSQ